jgi:hypothetical protein
MNLDWVFWRIPVGARSLCHELEHALNLERYRTYLWSSKTLYQAPADLYLHLVHGHIYQNARAWPRKWKFCCELDAFELYVWLTGLELATEKKLYNLLRRQILLSVVARQSPDGGWYHGEWTDMKECHYRFHAGALLLLENALDEWTDSLVQQSLARGASFVASRTDTTDLGLWFLHDSLEGSAEMMNEMLKQTGSIAKGFGAWKPSRALGKSPTNKMILNTHVDTTIALDRYQASTGDQQYQKLTSSARDATRALLALRPAEGLYRLVYRAVALTMLPASEAKQLSFPVRAVRRLATKYLRPNLYRVKRLFPRLVMPGGIVDRHLSPLHFDEKYHAVNLMDLARYWRRFPEEKLDRVVRDAIQFVVASDTSILRWWAETKPRQSAIVVFAEALCHLCMQQRDPGYRKYLAEAVLQIEDSALGLPPSILGGNTEIVGRKRQIPCPSPSEQRLRVANLSTVDRKELLVINPTNDDIELAWERSAGFPLVWTLPDGTPAAETGAPTRVPARGWLWGREGTGE